MLSGARQKFPPPTQLKNAQWGRPGTMQGYMYVRKMFVFTVLLVLKTQVMYYMHMRAFGSMSKLTPRPLYIFNFPEALVLVHSDQVYTSLKKSCDKVSGKVNISLHDQVQGLAGGVSDDLVREEVMNHECSKRLVPRPGRDKLLSHGDRYHKVDFANELQVMTATVHYCLESERLILIFAHSKWVDFEHQADRIPQPKPHPTGWE